MVEREDLAKRIDLERIFSRDNPVVEGLLQTGGKVVSPVYDAASYGLNQVGIRTPSFEQATGIKPFGYGPGASGESAFFYSPDPRIKARADEARYYSDTSQNSPLNLAIDAQKKAAASRFIPTTPDEKAAYSLALKNQSSFDSPAQAYMLQSRLERENEASPPRVTNNALKIGNAVGDNNRERSFLERLSQSGLLSVMMRIPRVEREGMSTLEAFTEATLRQQSDKSAAQQKQRKLDVDLEKERIKAGDGADAIRKMLAKGETQKLLSTAGNTFQMINASEKIRKILGVKGASGLANAAKTWATQFGNIFGLNLDPTAKQDVEKISALIKQQMAGSKIFGRDLSKSDYDVLANVLINPSIVTSDKGIRQQYLRLINNLQQTHSQSVKSLNILIGRDTTQQLLRQSNTTGNLFTNYNQGK